MLDMYGFIDESGAPGVAVNNNDFLVVSLVLFESEKQAEVASAAIDRLRGQLRLKKTYEFHCSRNTGFAQESMLKLIAKIDFHFITVAIKKTRNKRDASYARIVEMLAQGITKHCPRATLEMDSNPMLYRALKRELKAVGLSCKVREIESKTSNLIQLADYVVNICAKKLKNTTTSEKQYRVLADKQLVFLDVQ